MKCYKLMMVATLATSVCCTGLADLVPPPQKYKLSVTIGSGKGSVSGAGTYKPGTKVTVRATPASGYKFKSWSVSDCSDCAGYSQNGYASSVMKWVMGKGKSVVKANFKKKLAVPKPSASDGKYAGGIKVTWKKSSGAVRYRVRRGKSKTYSKSSVVATVEGTSYFDTDVCGEMGKQYYWILPVDKDGSGYSAKAKFDVGHAKLVVKVGGPSSLYVGEKYQYSMQAICSDVVGNRKWKIVSGGQFASLSKAGILTAKKAGKVVIQGTAWGKTAKKTITIKAGSPAEDNGEGGSASASQEGRAASVADRD